MFVCCFPFLVAATQIVYQPVKMVKTSWPSTCMKMWWFWRCGGGTPARPDFGGVLSGRGVQNADPNKVCWWFPRHPGKPSSSHTSHVSIGVNGTPKSAFSRDGSRGSFLPPQKVWLPCTYGDYAGIPANAGLNYMLKFWHPRASDCRNPICTSARRRSKTWVAAVLRENVKGGKFWETFLSFKLYQTYIPGWCEPPSPCCEPLLAIS